MPHSIEHPQLQGQGHALTRRLQGAMRYGLCHACCTKRANARCRVSAMQSLKRHAVEAASWCSVIT